MAPLNEKGDVPLAVLSLSLFGSEFNIEAVEM